MALGGHRQETKNKFKNTILAGLDWDINMATRVTTPWRVGLRLQHGQTTTHDSDREDRISASPTHKPHTCGHQTTDGGRCTKRIKEVDTTTLRKGHHHAGFFTVVSLHQSKPPDGMKTPRPSNHNTWGPRLIYRWTPLSCVRGPLHTRHTNIHDTTLSHKFRQNNEQRCPTHKDLHRNNQTIIVGWLPLVASHAQEAAAIELTDQGCRLRHFRTMYRTRWFQFQPCWNNLPRCTASRVAPCCCYHKCCPMT
jgi:hypothetical protein